jgi:hypothetical protein
MMDMTIYQDTPFKDADAFKDFLFANGQQHGIVATTLEGLGKAIDAYPLTDIVDMTDWMAIHNNQHQQEFNLLGLEGLPDLSEFDLLNEQEYHDFMYVHAAAHVAVNNALGLA